MWAECSIPLAALESSNIKLETNKNGKTPYGKLKYSDSTLQLDPISIVTPSLPILNYDFVRGRIDIDLAADSATLTKFQTIQDTIINLLHKQQYDWFQTNSLTTDLVKERFQPFLQGTVLSIYLSTLLKSGKPIWILKDNTWSMSLKNNTFQAGNSIRLVLKLIGIQSFISINLPMIPKNLKCHIVMHPLAVLFS